MRALRRLRRLIGVSANQMGTDGWLMMMIHQPVADVYRWMADGYTMLWRVLQRFIRPAESYSVRVEYPHISQRMEANIACERIPEHHMLERHCVSIQRRY